MERVTRNSRAREGRMARMPKNTAKIVLAPVKGGLSVSGCCSSRWAVMALCARATHTEWRGNAPALFCRPTRARPHAQPPKAHTLHHARCSSAPPHNTRQHHETHPTRCQTQSRDFLVATVFRRALWDDVLAALSSNHIDRCFTSGSRLFAAHNTTQHNTTARRSAPQNKHSTAPFLVTTVFGRARDDVLRAWQQPSERSCWQTRTPLQSQTNNTVQQLKPGFYFLALSTTANHC